MSYYHHLIKSAPVSPYPASLKLFIDAGNPASYSGTGTTVTDLIGTQNGTLTNGVGYSSANGGYFTFDGVNDYIDFGINNAIRTTAARTISLWININSGNGNFFSDSISPTGYQGAELWYDSSGFRSVVLGAATYQVAVNNPTANYNTWHYVTLSWNGTTLKAYWDGVINTSLAQTVIPINNTTNSTKLGLSNELGGRIPLNGKIAQCKIYNVQLSDAEVLTDFNEFKSRYIPTYGALTTAWIAARSITDVPTINAVNTFETDISSIVTKFHHIHFLFNGDATKNNYNFIGNATFNLTYFGSITHASTGIKSTTSGYFKTGYIPSTHSTLDSAHISYYSRTNNNSSNTCLLGGGVDLSALTALIPKWSSPKHSVPVNNAWLNYVGGADGAETAFNASAVWDPIDINNKFSISSRTASNYLEIGGRNVYDSRPVVSTSRTSAEIYGLCMNYGGPNFYSQSELTFISQGTGLTHSEMILFNGAVDTLMTTLGINV